MSEFHVYLESHSIEEGSATKGEELETITSRNHKQPRETRLVMFDKGILPNVPQKQFGLVNCG